MHNVASKDVDTSWTKKHGKNYFGDEISINADKRYKLSRKVVTDTAATHDSQHLDALLAAVGNNTSRDVYADRGYASLARKAKLKAASYTAVVSNAKVHVETSLIGVGNDISIVLQTTGRA